MIKAYIFNVARSCLTMYTDLVYEEERGRGQEEAQDQRRSNSSPKGYAVVLSLFSPFSDTPRALHRLDRAGPAVDNEDAFPRSC